MLRVVINGRFQAQPQTGVQRYARETVVALDRLLAQRADLAACLKVELALPPDAAPLALERIEPRVLPGPRGHLWEQIVLAWFARDAFLVNLNYSGPLAKRRQLITVHDATVAVSPETFSRTYRVLFDTLLALLKDRVELLMTVSHFSRGEIAQHFRIGRPIVVGREGWEHAVARGDDLATLRKYGLAPGKYLFAVGSPKPNKNFALLGQALQRLEDFPWPVAVAGARDTRVFNAGEPPPERVRMLGFVEDDELAHLYRHAAWFVFPSLYEGFGLPALEAMGNGCPVLAARAASIPEVCGDAALYFDPHDPTSLAALLEHVALHPELREQMLARARHRLAFYSWHANAEILAGLLLRAAADERPALAGQSSA